MATSTASPTTADWTMSYRGDAFADNTMDALRLSLALRSVHSLVSQSNNLVNGNSAVASIRISAPKAGSFEVELLLTVTAIADVLRADFFSSAIQIGELLLGSAKGIGVLGVFQRLGGRIFSVTNESPESVTVEAGETGLDIPLELFRICNNSGVQMAIRGIVDPLRGTEIPELVIQQGNGTSLSINAADIDPSYWSNTDPDPGEVIRVPRQALTIVAPNLDNPTAKWRLSDGSNTNWYSILDEEFVRQVRDGVERFGTGDSLVCDVTIAIAIGNDRKVLSQFSVTRVIEHRQRGTQEPFPA